MSKTEPPKPNAEEPRKKPRGLGGVILILALMMALFVVVSQAGPDSNNSFDGFMRHLLRGEVSQLTVSTDGVATARIRSGGEQVSGMEVVVQSYLRGDENFLPAIHSLTGRPLDTTVYATRGAAGFLTDLNGRPADGENPAVDPVISVKHAWFVTEIPGEGQTRQNYMTALLQRGDRDEYVKVSAANASAADAVTLTDLRNALQSQSVKFQDWSLHEDPRAFSFSQPNTALIYVLGTIGPWILVLAIIWFFILRQVRSPGGGGGVLSFGRSRAALYTRENRTNISFGDVAGMEEAKSEVKEIIEFLKNPGKFAKLGGHIPRGVLLIGSPGTGKTLLAKAIAGEAEVPFFSISGSDFVEMFVGVGASRVRDLFKQAREASPCIIFLDEIDAVGRKRGTGMGGGHDEREQTLNAILVEMDGFDSDKGIILVGATNRPDVLDPALLRPGRFDRQVTIDMPDVNGRMAILKVHSRKVKLSPIVELEVIARATPGFSGAELAAVINEGAILAAMKNKESIELADLEEARDRVRWGREKRSRAIEEEDRKVTAYHEAGHALVSCLVPDQDPVHKVTIVSRGRSLGATMSLPEKDDYNHWRQKLLGRIAVCFGGRIAEDIVFGDVSAGAQNDIEQATHLAKMMVCELGMSEKVGPIKYTATQENPFLGGDFQIASDISPDTLELINSEVRRLIEEQYEAAKKLIVDNRNLLDSMAEGLLAYESLSGAEISAIVRGDDLEEFRAASRRSMAEAEREAKLRNQEEEERDDRPDVDLSGAEGLAHS